MGPRFRPGVAKRLWPAAVALAAGLLSWSLVGVSGQHPSESDPLSGVITATHPSSPQGFSASTYQAVLNQYCVVCHNEHLRTAGLVLSRTDVANVSQGAAVWEKVINKLQTGAMPPAGAPRPDQATYNSLIAYLEGALDRASAATPHPGRPAVHRLNRAEYANAVHDLLGTEINVESLLPADDSGEGFDNIADILSVSPTLLESYMSAGTKISRSAIGDPTLRPALTTYDVSPLLVQDDRMSENLPFGSRGGISIRHDFPLDAEYVLKIRLQRDPSDQILGLAEPHELEVRLDGERIKVFTVGGLESAPSKVVENRFFRPKDPGRDKYESTADDALKVRFPAKAGPRLIGVDFRKEAPEPEGVVQANMVGFYPLRKDIFKGSGPAVDKVTIDGPFNATGPGDTPSRRRIFICRPTRSEEEAPCAKKILSMLARRAYRRPVTDEEVKDLFSLYEAGRTQGGFEAGIGMAIEGMLVTPKFLFRIEQPPAHAAPGTAYRINDLDLASNLSFFLWSSIPDDELLNVAAARKLRDPAVLERQVRRMLADSRSDALVSNFAGQWLYVRNMSTVVPDSKVFPDFNENLREAFERETDLFLESNLREDRSVLNLLNADYTFVNERLAKFYGIPGVFGNYFRRVSLAGHEERWGLLGQGSILTVTSYPNRTSPTVRGKFLLSNILGTPPPPPPPNVPSLKEDHTEDGKVLTMRQRMEAHRENPACAVCHVRMDPLGFSLENFDAIGKWRSTSEANAPVDASGVLPDGTKFEGPAGLRKMLLSHPEQFATTVTEKLLTYALGRRLEYYDEPVVRRITREAAPGGYRWSSLILGVVKSASFQMRMTHPKEPAAVKTIASEIK